VNGKAGGKTIEKLSHTIENVKESSFQSIENPSKDNLAKLKEALNLAHGFLKYKVSGDKVYHVVYDPELKRQKWKIIGTWTELKEQLLPLVTNS
jgi:hypothetical protein